MSRWVVRLFGRIPLISLDSEEYEYDTGLTEIGGGATHDFERDLEPIDAMGEEPWDDSFGFRR